MRMFLEELGCQDALNRTNCGQNLTADDKTENRKAYLKLAVACDDPVSHQLGKRSTSTDFPQGDATAAWAALQHRWAPRNEIDKQTAVTQLFAMKLEDASLDPEKWIIELQEKQAKLSEMGEQVTDSLMIAHILINVPKEYEGVVDMLSRDKTKTIASVSDELKQKFERMKAAGDTEDYAEKAMMGHKMASDACQICKKNNHKTSDCFFRNKGTAHRINGACFYCGKVGHRKSDCYLYIKSRDGKRRIVRSPYRTTNSGGRT
jgi:hypothetical protein